MLEIAVNVKLLATADTFFACTQLSTGYQEQHRILSTHGNDEGVVAWLRTVPERSQVCDRAAPQH
jgi:hypothetical protein